MLQVENYATFVQIPETAPRSWSPVSCSGPRITAPRLVDLDHDAADVDRRVMAPLLALWGAKGTVGQLYDGLETWREKALDVRGRALDCGHTLQEEAPKETLSELLAFPT